jgi:hypothetical protein
LALCFVFHIFSPTGKASSTLLIGVGVCNTSSAFPAILCVALSVGLTLVKGFFFLNCFIIVAVNQFAFSSSSVAVLNTSFIVHNLFSYHNTSSAISAVLAALPQGVIKVGFSWKKGNAFTCLINSACASCCVWYAVALTLLIISSTPPTISGSLSCGTLSSCFTNSSAFSSGVPTTLFFAHLHHLVKAHNVLGLSRNAGSSSDSAFLSQNCSA